MTLTELLSFANYGLVLLYGVFCPFGFPAGFIVSGIGRCFLSSAALFCS